MPRISREAPMDDRTHVDNHSRTVRSEPRGPHWIAWIVGADGKPEERVVLVGGTREQAEERARRWAAGRQTTALP